jgi:hypothetical protein
MSTMTTAHEEFSFGGALYRASIADNGECFDAVWDAADGEWVPLGLSADDAPALQDRFAVAWKRIGK